MVSFTAAKGCSYGPSIPVVKRHCDVHDGINGSNRSLRKSKHHHTKRKSKENAKVGFEY